MSSNGCPVIDMDCHIMERPERMYQDYIDPGYREPYDRLCQAIAKQAEAGFNYSLFGTRHAVIEPIEAGRPLGVRDTFGISPQRGAQKRIIKGREAAAAEAKPLIRPEVNWDVKARLEDMDRASIDVNVLFATYVSSYCALRDVGFENALYRAYDRWVSDFCAQAPDRLKWTLVANMRDLPSAETEIRYWAERDPNLVGIYLSPRAPDGSHLDNPNLHPLYDLAQELELPLLIHPGTARPPYGPGTFDLDGAWFLQQSLENAWSGMAAAGALIGGGVFDLFPRLRAACVEPSASWLPLAVERFDANFISSPHLVPNLQRLPSEIIAEGRYFHTVDSWERGIDYCVQELGEDIWLFSTDFPHKGTQWPDAVQQVVTRAGLSESAKRKMLCDNALKVCPRLAGSVKPAQTAAA